MCPSTTLVWGVAPIYAMTMMWRYYLYNYNDVIASACRQLRGSRHLMSGYVRSTVLVVLFTARKAFSSDIEAHAEQAKETK